MCNSISTIHFIHVSNAVSMNERHIRVRTEHWKWFCMTFVGLFMCVFQDFSGPFMSIFHAFPGLFNRLDISNTFTLLLLSLKADTHLPSHGPVQWYDKLHDIKCIHEVWNVGKWACCDELQPTLISVPSNQLTIIANYTNFPVTSIKFQDISSISRSCRHLGTLVQCWTFLLLSFVKHYTHHRWQLITTNELLLHFCSGLWNTRL